MNIVDLVNNFGYCNNDQISQVQPLILNLILC